MPAPRPLTLERIFASPDLAGAQPRGVKLSPDGTLVTLLRNRADDRERYDLWAIDTTTGAERMLVDSLKLGSGAELSEAEKMQRERARIGGTRGIVSYDWAADGKHILVPIDGDLFLADLSGGVVRLTNSPQGALNATVSPKGTFLSSVRDGNVFVTRIADRTEKQLTSDASETLSWGVAEFVAQEEMDRFTGHWWSPDDSRIAVARVDESGVGIVNRAAIGAEGTKIFAQRYPAAGTPNAVVDLYVMNPDGSGRVKVDLGPERDIYLARVNWAKDGRTLYVQRESRDQKRLDLLAVDPATGASRIVLTETAKTWINLSNNFRPLNDGSFLWWSERGGQGQLYRVKNGKWTELTKGEGEVADVVGLDEARGLVYFTSNAQNPLEQQVFSAPIDRYAAPRQLTGSGYWNAAVMDGRATRLIVSRSNSEQPMQVYLADTEGKRLRWLSENALDARHPYAPYLQAHARTQFGTIKAVDGTPLHYKLLMPKGAAGTRHPVFMIHYGGPGAGRQVTNQWGGAIQQYLVQQGWVVFAIDNRGTPDRGKAFEDALYRAMGTVEVEDQVAGVNWLKAQEFVDPARIATYGWSYGGYLTIKLLEKAPGLFAAGVSGAPVTKWELYDTHYTERYLGDPKAKNSAYPAANALADVEKIADPLLLIHGMADDNVVLEHSTAFMSAMQAKARPFEVMLYPGQTHRFAGEGTNVHSWRTIEQFLERTGVAPGKTDGR
ncbi:S9 family peptidase [Sphingobium subterraneum]|nr:S9 family peptidase [Sphingobium subterraneum]